MKLSEMDGNKPLSFWIFEAENWGMVIEFKIQLEVCHPISERNHISSKNTGQFEVDFLRKFPMHVSFNFLEEELQPKRFY